MIKGMTTARRALNEVEKHIRNALKMSPEAATIALTDALALIEEQKALRINLPQLGGGITPQVWLRSGAMRDEQKGKAANARAREARAIATWLDQL